MKKGKYHLISYCYRRHSDNGLIYANCVIDRSPVEWLLENQDDDRGTTTMLNTHTISKQEYERCLEKL